MDAENVILNLVRKSLSENSDFVYLPKTAFYNEGWLLRLALEEFYNWPLKKLNPKDFGKSWLSEGLLQPPFKKEGSTHVDAIMGDYKKRPGTKAGLMLDKNAKRLIVFEAKLFSWFSKKVENALNYNQVARTVACITHLFCSGESQIDLSNFKNRLGLVLLLPKEVITGKEKELNEIICKCNIRDVINERIKSQDNLRTDSFKVLLPEVINELKIEVISWEAIIEELTWITRYYDSCLRYNKKTKTMAN